MAAEVDEPGDDQLRLIFLCAHPTLAPEAGAALSLRLVLGVSTADIARLFLVPEPTMAARLTRAKRKLAVAGAPFVVPEGLALEARLAAVNTAVYLAFTAGYAPASGSDATRVALSGEAIRLVRILRRLLPRPELDALLALMLLQHARRDARTGVTGRLVLLPDQDRSRWRQAEIGEGLTARCVAGGGGGVPPPGGERGRPRGGGGGRGHPLGSDRGVLRRARGAHRITGRAAEPRGGGG